MVMRLAARTMRLCLGHLYLLSPSSTSAAVKRCRHASSAVCAASMWKSAWQRQVQRNDADADANAMHWLG